MLPRLPPNFRHTTEHEIAFLRQLEREGKRVQLKAYRKSFPHRDWNGLGMEINRSAIEKELGRILGKESAEERKESYEEFVSRVAVAWLGGGRLRRISQDRVLADQGEV